MKYVEYDGPCLMLFCLATGPHKHPICPKCGAVAYGNINCDVCSSPENVDMEREITIIQIAKRGGTYAS